MNHDYLDERERNLVATFNENKPMRDAVKKVLLAGIYVNGTVLPGQEVNFKRNTALALVSKGPAYSNEQIGADLRALWEGGQMVEQAFQVIEEDFVKSPIKKKVEKNPAI